MIVLRPAEFSDAEQLLAWVNQSDSLSNKRLTQQPIAWPNHAAWLKRVLADPNARLWIIESGGEPVGQLRLSPDAAGRRVVDIYLIGTARKHGFAAMAIQAGLAEAASLWPEDAVYAEVMTANESSHRLFLRSGFVRENVYSDHVFYKAVPTMRDRT